MNNFDVLILGSGLAGQSLALRLADHRRVALVTKSALEDSASGWAQGGIAAVLDSTDTIDAHVADTLTAGAGLCNPAATRFVVEHSHAAIDWLIGEGVSFTRDESSSLGYHLTREGGHSQRRVIHVADATGSAVQKTLTEKVRQHANISVFERHIAIDLITGDKIKAPDIVDYTLHENVAERLAKRFGAALGMGAVKEMSRAGWSLH
ncbi:L-aspartate oxidase [mine drainage metagenome]|uniref:L-aspartate oxidase n=1 Tax=mine drainage metagenome TaxID=410659 RepID=A0A1J5RWV3_9ZZZZ